MESVHVQQTGVTNNNHLHGCSQQQHAKGLLTPFSTFHSPSVINYFPLHFFGMTLASAFSKENSVCSRNCMASCLPKKGGTCKWPLMVLVIKFLIYAMPFSHFSEWHVSKRSQAGSVPYVLCKVIHSEKKSFTERSRYRIYFPGCKIRNICLDSWAMLQSPRWRHPPFKLMRMMKYQKSEKKKQSKIHKGPRSAQTSVKSLAALTPP